MKSIINATILVSLVAVATAPSFARAEPREEVCGPDIQKILLADCRVDLPYEDRRMVESSRKVTDRIYYTAEYHHSWIQRSKYLYIITDSSGQVTQKEVVQDTPNNTRYSETSSFEQPLSWKPWWVREQARREFEVAMLEVALSQCQD